MVRFSSQGLVSSIRMAVFVCIDQMTPSGLEPGPEIDRVRVRVRGTGRGTTTATDAGKV